MLSYRKSVCLQFTHSVWFYTEYDFRQYIVLAFTENVKSYMQFVMLHAMSDFTNSTVWCLCNKHQSNNKHQSHISQVGLGLLTDSLTDITSIVSCDAKNGNIWYDQVKREILGMII